MFASRFLSRALPSLVVAATIGAPALAGAVTIYSQPYLETTNGAYFANVQGGYTQYDSFSLTADASITSVSWSGFDLNELLPGTVLNPTSFLVNIYSETANGHPGTLLSTTTIGNSGNAVNTGIMFQNTVTLYSYSGNLATPFQATAGKNYWLEINDPTDNNDWYWATGAGPDGTHLSKITGQGTNVTGDDLAFTLSNVAAVPEPASYALFLLGAGVLLGVQARRKAGRRA
jgi:hypothetical protein